MSLLSSQKKALNTSHPKDEASQTRCLSQPLKMLVRIARQNRLGDPDACATVLAMLFTSRLLHQHFQRALARLDLSEVKLTTLVSLYAIDPEPSTPADLALQSQVSRAAMTDTLETMRLRNWIVRDPAQNDRRVLHIHLTDEGRALVERAVIPFLSTVNLCAQVLTRDEHATAISICAHLNAYFRSQPA